MNIKKRWVFVFFFLLLTCLPLFSFESSVLWYWEDYVIPNDSIDSAGAYSLQVINAKGQYSAVLNISDIYYMGLKTGSKALPGSPIILLDGKFYITDDFWNNGTINTYLDYKFYEYNDDDDYRYLYSGIAIEFYSDPGSDPIYTIYPSPANGTTTTRSLAYIRSLIGNKVENIKYFTLVFISSGVISRNIDQAYYGLKYFPNYNIQDAINSSNYTRTQVFPGYYQKFILDNEVSGIELNNDTPVINPEAPPENPLSGIFKDTQNNHITYFSGNNQIKLNFNNIQDPETPEQDPLNKHYLGENFNSIDYNYSGAGPKPAYTYTSKYLYSLDEGATKTEIINGILPLTDFDGIEQVKIYAKDYFGNITPDDEALELSICYDNAPPEPITNLEIEGLDTDGYLGQGSIEAKWSGPLEDVAGGSGIKGSKYTWVLKGSNDSENYTKIESGDVHLEDIQNSESISTGYIYLGNGETYRHYKLTVSLEDNVGNESSASLEFSRAPSPPVPENTSVEGASFSKDGIHYFPADTTTVEILWEYSEEHISEVESFIISLSQNGSIVQIYNNIEPSNRSYSVPLNSGDKEDFYSISIKAVGNKYCESEYSDPVRVMTIPDPGIVTFSSVFSYETSDGNKPCFTWETYSNDPFISFLLNQLQLEESVYKVEYQCSLKDEGFLKSNLSDEDFTYTTLDTFFLLDEEHDLGNGKTLFLRAKITLGSEHIFYTGISEQSKTFLPPIMLPDEDNSIVIGDGESVCIWSNKHVITCPYIVEEGGTLIIAEGARIYIDYRTYEENFSTAINPRIMIEIKGALEIQYDADDTTDIPIAIFTSSTDPDVLDWDNYVIEEDDDGPLLNWDGFYITGSVDVSLLKVSNATRAITLVGDNNTRKIDKCTFIKNGTGVHLYKAEAEITNSIFSDNVDYGIKEDFMKNYDPVIKSNTFNSNGPGGNRDYYDSIRAILTIEELNERYNSENNEDNE